MLKAPSPASLVAAATLTSLAPAQAATNAAAGKKVFDLKCAICHATVAGKTIVGPSLFGVVGRKAGSLDGFPFSVAMKNAHRTWDEATLNAYLADPRQDIPWIKTIFAALFGEDQLNQNIGCTGPVDDSGERQNVIAYLATLK
jgi:cytochrome c